VERHGVADEAPHGVRERVKHGLRQALQGNATAFGYSVTITASFGAVQYERGQPAFGDLLVFGLGAVLAFSALEGVLTRGFRDALPGGSTRVVTLGTALSFVSVSLAISGALGAATVLHGRAAWFLGSLVASLLFVGTEGLEFALAERVQERRGER